MASPIGNQSGEISESQKEATMDSEKPDSIWLESNIHSAAGTGFAATNRYGAPIVELDKAAERRLRWKIDLMVIPSVALIYLFCFIDRANIGNARLAGLEKDLGMTGAYDYNQLLSIFYISYILFEIPCNMACKWMGPGWFIPILALGFGIASIGTAFVQDLPQACGVRFVLGVFESGMMPGTSYYLSRWYRRSELTFRLSLYVIMVPLAGAFGGLLASAILKLPSFGSLTEWRMIFAIEGIVTVGVALIAFFTITDRPETARWLTAEEKELAIARVKSERVSQTSVLDEYSHKKAWLGIWNPVVLATAWLFFLTNITVQGLAFFLPTIVSKIYPDDTVIQQQLATVPPYIVGAFFTLLLPGLSWKLDKRQIFIILSAPLVMTGFLMFLASSDGKVRYAATFLIASSIFALGPLTNGQASAQVISDTSRSMSLATSIMLGNVGGMVSSWSYIEWDAPDYKIGNGINFAAASGVLLFGILTLWWTKWDNKRRDKRDIDQELANLSQKEIENLEWKHPAWRWAP